jgi:hypothetical protein
MMKCMSDDGFGHQALPVLHSVGGVKATCKGNRAVCDLKDPKSSIEAKVNMAQMNRRKYSFENDDFIVVTGYCIEDLTAVIRL